MLNIDSPNLSQTATILSGQLKGSSADFNGVSIDSRTTEKGNLFIALRGPNFDGHDFVLAAIKKGAVAVMVEKWLDIDIPQVKVNNTSQALQTLAKAWRAQVNIPIVGITGSSGKTSVKEMVAAIMQQHSAGLSTSGNLNNLIGVPLTLLKLRTSHRWAVIEMGASEPGEIEQLTEIVRPTISLVNNISSAHIQGFGSKEQTARTKGSIYSLLNKDDVALIPANSKYRKMWTNMTKSENIISFGDNDSADFYFSNQTIYTPDAKIEVNLPIKSEQMYFNSTAATAICTNLGQNLQNIKNGLESYQSPKGRLNQHKHKSGAIIIDDSYNANPASVAAAIDYLKTFSNKRILVLGDMAELGDKSQKAHCKIGTYAKKANIQQIFSFGSESKYASDSFKGIHFTNKDMLLKQLTPKLNSNTTVLIKGSRMMKMDTIVDALLNSKEGSE